MDILIKFYKRMQNLDHLRNEYFKITGINLDNVDRRNLIIRCIIHDVQTGKQDFEPILRSENKSIYRDMLEWEISDPDIFDKPNSQLLSVLIIQYPKVLKYVLDNLSMFGLTHWDCASSIIYIFYFDIHLNNYEYESTKIIMSFLSKIDIIKMLNEHDYLWNHGFPQFLIHVVMTFDTKYKLQIKNISSFLNECVRYFKNPAYERSGNISQVIWKYKLGKYFGHIDALMCSLLIRKDAKQYLELYNEGYRCSRPGYQLFTMFDEDIFKTADKNNCDVNALMERMPYYCSSGFITVKECMKAADIFVEDIDNFILTLDSCKNAPTVRGINSVFLLTYFSDYLPEKRRNSSSTHELLREFSTDYMLIISPNSSSNSSTNLLTKKWKTNFRLLLQFHSNLANYNISPILPFPWG